MPRDLDLLRSAIQSTFGSVFRRLDGWSDPSLSQRIEEIRRWRDEPVAAADRRTIGMAVAAFRASGQPASRNEMKYVCLGAGTPDDQGGILLAEAGLRDKLLAFAASQSKSSQPKFFRCLLHSYFAFPLNDPKTGESAREGWRELRNWLAERRKEIGRRAQTKPNWLSALERHANLLGESPCARYGPALVAGDGSELRDAIECLGIPAASWVGEEAVLAQIRAACAQREANFKGALPTLLDIANGAAGTPVPRPLAIRCVALLVSRYANCAERPEHPQLRDAALSLIGNPWLRRAAWDAFVVDESGAPDEAARAMVNSWLKRRLIGDFFKLLDADHVGDTRRLHYWLRFEPFIEDMWFALGPDARRKGGETFDDFRSRAKGRLMSLDHSAPDNNAFLMRIGPWLAVEFGQKNHACYLLRWDSLPHALSRKLLSVDDRTVVSVHALKLITAEGKLIHSNSRRIGLTWEEKFDRAICPVAGAHPEIPPRSLSGQTIERNRAAESSGRGQEISRTEVAKSSAVSRLRAILDLPANWTGNSQAGRKSGEGNGAPRDKGPERFRPKGQYEIPSFVPPAPAGDKEEARLPPDHSFSQAEFDNLVKEKRLTVADNRGRGGALWVSERGAPEEVGARLLAWGFRRKPGKGWWKE